MHGPMDSTGDGAYKWAMRGYRERGQTLSDAQGQPPEVIDLTPFSIPTIPQPSDTVPQKADDPARRELSRHARFIAGQLHMRMAIVDKDPTEIAQMSGVPDDVVAKILSAQGADATIDQVFRLAIALGGSAAVRLLFPDTGQMSPPKSC